MLQIDLWKRILIWATVAVGLGLALPNLFYPRVEQHNDAVAAIEQSGETPERLAQSAGWPDFLPSGLVNLGLDLRGGAHLLAEVKVEDVYASRLEALWPDVRDVLRPERATVGTIRLQESDPGELRVSISQPEGMERALQLVRGLAQPVASLSGSVSNDLTVRADGSDIVVTLSEAEQIATDERTMQQSLEIIRRRIDEVGTREPTIQRQGGDRILIQVPGIGSAAELKEIIGTTAQLTFQPVVGRTDDADARAGVGNEILPYLDQDGYVILEQAPVVTGDELVDAQPAFDQNGRPAVNFRFNPAGARDFGDYTAANVGNPFAIVLDNEVLSDPVIQSHIPGGVGDHHRQFHRRGEHPTGGAAARRCPACRHGFPGRADHRPGTGPGQHRGRAHCDHHRLRRRACVHGAQLRAVRAFCQFGADHQHRADLRVAEPDRRNAHAARYRGDRVDGRHGGGCQRADL